MRIHHLNCGSLFPRFPKLRAIVYCLLVETSDGLLLVDSGFGTRDYTHPSLLMRVFLWLMGVPCDVEETAVRQVARLGYAVDDVKHIVLTHLNLDHAGGLPDFPHAQIHLFRKEYEAMQHPHLRQLAEGGYVRRQWAHGPNWVFHNLGDETWFGFDAIRILPDVSPEIRLVPLPGHTRGHCGVAIQTPTGWLFHCGDAASPFHRDTAVYQRADVQQPFNHLPLGRLSERLIGPNVPRLRQLIREHGDDIDIISGHDIYSFEKHRIES